MKVLYVIPGEEEGSSMIFARRQIEFLASSGIETYSFFIRSRINPMTLAGEYSRFRKVLQTFQPDIVHCHYGTMTAFFAAYSNSKPLVVTFHGSDLNFLKSGNFFKELAGKSLSQLAALRASAIICVSEKIRKKLWWRKNKVSVLPMGVDETFFTPIDKNSSRLQLGIQPEEKIILFNYANAPLKRLDIAEKVLSLVKVNYPQSRLWVLKGTTPPGQIHQLLNACDCLLLCSDSEGSPTIVKEAMACNLPVVSADVGDVKMNTSQYKFS